MQDFGGLLKLLATQRRLHYDRPVQTKIVSVLYEHCYVARYAVFGQSALCECSYDLLLMVVLMF